MALQIRRGTDSQRQAATFAQGEAIYTTDTKDLWIGDGSTQGGTQIAPVKSVNGQTGIVLLTTDQVGQGQTNKYYSATQAKIDAGTALTGGNGQNTGITFSYNSQSNTISAVVSVNAGITSVSADTSPQLGGNLSLNFHTINGSGNINITGTVAASAGLGGNLSLNGYQLNGNGSILVQGDQTNNVGISLATGLTGSAGLTQQGPVYRTIARNGTQLSPTVLAVGDSAGSYNFQGHVNGGALGVVDLDLVSIKGVVNNAGDLSTNCATGKLQMIVLNGLVPSAAVVAEFTNKGVFSAPVFQTGSYNGAGAYPATPSAGMMIFDSSNNHFYGYNGSVWKQLDN
jgi:hypothetical protein